jgi:tRNA (guanine10-N2)-dimethyltransferase
VANLGNEARVLVRFGWHNEFALASLRALASEVDLLRPDLAVSVGVPRRLAQMGLVHEVVEFLGIAAVGAVPFDPDVIVSPYAVRVHDERRFSPEERSELLSALWACAPTPRIDLDLPRTVLHAYWTPRGVAWGRRLPYAVFRPSNQQARPFVRSYVVPSRKARWLNDLANVVAGGTVLDPFCGTGSLLLEAAKLGASVCGSDVNRDAVLGTAANLRAEGFVADLRVTDARARYADWGTTFDAIVTDLPYGRSAAVRARDVETLAVQSLDATRHSLSPDGRIVVMAPSGVLPDAPKGLAVEHRLQERVHRSLAREIVVCIARGQDSRRTKLPGSSGAPPSEISAAAQ